MITIAMSRLMLIPNWKKNVSSPILYTSFNIIIANNHEDANLLTGTSIRVARFRGEYQCCICTTKCHNITITTIVIMYINYLIKIN